MVKRESDIKNDGVEIERFVDFARKLVSVPKKEIDKRIEAEKKAKDEKKKATA